MLTRLVQACQATELLSTAKHPRFVAITPHCTANDDRQWQWDQSVRLGHRPTERGPLGYDAKARLAGVPVCPNYEHQRDSSAPKPPAGIAID